MADTPQTANSYTVSNAFDLDGDGIDKLATLGQRASGVTLEFVNLGDYGLSEDGLPDAFPVAILHGERPELKSVKALAEEWRGHPQHRQGTAALGDVSSFNALVNRQKTPASAVFVNSDWTKPSLTAVIDYHGAAATDLAGFGRHRVHYAFPFSDEWKVWLTHDGKAMDQREFAEFIEERAPDMVALDAAENVHHALELQLEKIGSPADVFHLARGLEIFAGVQVKQNVKLQSGEATLAFEEAHTGKNGEALQVPGAFALSIPLFYNEEPIVIPVRLRYRVVNGAVLWTYKLFRVDRIVAEAVRQAKKEVEQQTGLPVYEGAPEMLASGAPVATGR